MIRCAVMKNCEIDEIFILRAGLERTVQGPRTAPGPSPSATASRASVRRGRSSDIFISRYRVSTAMRLRIPLSVWDRQVVP